MFILCVCIYILYEVTCKYFVDNSFDCCTEFFKLYSFAYTKSCINTLVMILSRRSNHILINRILPDSHSDILASLMMSESSQSQLQ